MSLLIGDNLIVNIHYTLTDDDDKVLDSSTDFEPLVYLHGANNIIPGLENALTGKAEGDTLQVYIDPDEAYGASNPELIYTADIASFQNIEDIKVGMKFETRTPEDNMQLVTVIEIDGDLVTIDSNHPLAGLSLNFDVEIISVREPTPEEMDYWYKSTGPDWSYPFNCVLKIQAR